MGGAIFFAFVALRAVVIVTLVPAVLFVFVGARPVLSVLFVFVSGPLLLGLLCLKRSGRGFCTDAGVLERAGERRQPVSSAES